MSFAVSITSTNCLLIFVGGETPASFENSFHSFCPCFVRTTMLDGGETESLFEYVAGRWSFGAGVVDVRDEVPDDDDDDGTKDAVNADTYDGDCELEALLLLLVVVLQLVSFVIVC